MGPKKIQTGVEEELEEIKASLGKVLEQTATIAKQQKTIMDLMDEIKVLKMQNEEKDKRMDALEQRLADLEQYSRINDLIITGLVIKPRSYAKAVATGGEPTELDQESAEQQVVNFLNSKDININTRDIEACHPLPKRDKRPHAVIVRFVNRKQKMDVLKQGKKLKGTNVYINEHLTKKNSEVARQARILKKQKRIQATWTSNCKIFIKLNGAPEEAKVLWIRNLHDLDKYQ